MRTAEGCLSFVPEISKQLHVVEITIFNLMQIGELARTSLSDEIKNQIQTIPWTQLYGMRDRIVHGCIRRMSQRQFLW